MPARRMFAGRIAVYFGLFGFTWIFASDWVVGRISAGAAQMQALQSAKGSVFVLLSMLVIYLLVRFESRKADAARRHARHLEDLLERALGVANSAAFLWDRPSDRVEFSFGLCRMLGIEDARAGVPPHTWRERIHPHDRERNEGAIAAHLDGATERYDCVFRVRAGDGAFRWIRAQGLAPRTSHGAGQRLLGTVSDVTELQEAHEASRRTAGILRVLLGANHAILSAATEPDLFQKVCEALTEEDRYPLAWIGLVRDDPEQAIEIVAAAGEARASTSEMRVSWATEAAGGAAARAVRSADIQLLRECPGEGCCPPGAGAGQWSSLAIPITTDHAVVGVLTLYGELPSSFEADERSVLANVGQDIGYALGNLRRQQRMAVVEQGKHDAEARVRMNLIGAVKSLALTVEMRDPYTAGHQERVAELAVAIATELGLPRDVVDDIWLGAAIHDIGKIRIPTEILTRPGKLEAEEFALIKLHPIYGGVIIQHAGLSPRVGDIIVQHHERLDGSGYPHGLRGDAIAPCARIVAVADVVEAMSAHRPYRPALGLEQALGCIRAARGVSLDAEAVDACARVIESGAFDLPWPPDRPQQRAIAWPAETTEWCAAG